MHKTFYASGFLYHFPSEQILLQQKLSSSPVTPTWVLFEKQHAENKKPEEIFTNAILKILKVNLNSLNKVYSYTLDHAKNYSLFYATVEKKEEFTPSEGFNFRWFSFKEILKIKAAQQTKHDIIIAQRVIEALKRDNDINLQKLIEDASNE